VCVFVLATKDICFSPKISGFPIFISLMNKKRFDSQATKYYM
jgi:hypothetical protein